MNYMYDLSYKKHRRSAIINLFNNLSEYTDVFI